VIKTLIFGTGNSAVQLLKNLPDKRSYLAAVDNDADKHGQYFDDLLIISPDQIANYEYDEILIASYWEGTIKKQLIEELKIPADKVVTPQKKYYKNGGETLYPFQDEATMALARKVITTLCGAACEQKLPLHIDYGTLLGIMRDGDLIAWDDDIDLACESRYAPELEIFLLEQVQNIDSSVNWSVRKDSDCNDRALHFYISFTPSAEKQFKTFAISIAVKGIEGDKAVKLSSFGAWFNPAKHLLSMDTINWSGTNIYTPNDADGYLKFSYGNWQSPKKDLTVGEGENWACVPIEKIKQAKMKSEIIFEQHD
jgi:hypothetical protein